MENIRSDEKFKFAYQNNLRTSGFAYHMVKILVVWLMENIRSDEIK